MIEIGVVYELRSRANSFTGNDTTIIRIPPLKTPTGSRLFLGCDFSM